MLLFLVETAIPFSFCGMFISKLCFFVVVVICFAFKWYFTCTDILLCVFCYAFLTVVLYSLSQHKTDKWHQQIVQEKEKK